ncbi:unnamed protein product [Clonostachys rosea]|uniref:Alpha-1,3-glucosyltransferase n=1 Tax=Bionectria ochroleuca TaxID=29856 RepID=A0ABY6TZD5_BIOOC|nr:unnamed protein product [Clonostachys rosea]
MPQAGPLVWRVALAVPLLYISYACVEAFAVDKLVALQEPYLQSGKIEWADGGSITILERFWHVQFLDELWRRFTVTFAPSTLAFDPVSSWQAFSFLNDLGPLFTIWILESSRVGNRYTPAWLPTIFAFSGQVMSLGAVTPLFYILCIIFSPSSSKLVAETTPAGQRRITSTDSSPVLLPILLFLHTFELVYAYGASELSTRHYWTWAWQMTPLFVGLANTSMATLISLSPSVSRQLKPISSPHVLLGVPTAISAGIWIYTLIFSPHSISTLFLPLIEPQDALEPLLRRGLQIDELCVFGSSLLWIGYHIADLYVAGHVSTSEIFNAISLFPVVAALTGPGASLSYLWLWRESKLQRSHV